MIPSTAFILVISGLALLALGVVIGADSQKQETERANLIIEEYEAIINTSNMRIKRLSQIVKTLGILEGE